jgi:Outer membrane protein beta-barrel domain
MSRTLLGVLLATLVCTPTMTHAQNHWRFDLRGGAAVATQDLGDASLETGFGFEGTMGYRVQPHLWVYAGWDWHRFNAEASFAGADSDFEETGYAFGLEFEHPIGQSKVAALQLRAGGMLNHIEVENSVGDVVADSDHGLGWEGGAGLALRLGEQWQFTPGVRFRSLSRELTVGTAATPVDLRYVAVELGVSRSF